MKKLSLTIETLQVDSFSTDPLAGRDWLAPGIVTTLPKRTCPECANTGPYATCE